MWGTPLTFPGLITILSLPGLCGLRVTMILQPWGLFLAVECIFACVSGQSSPQRRRCAFHVTPQNYRYTDAGNVSGSVQFCEKTQCCVGYYVVINGQPKVNVLACDLVEKRCPDATCKAETRMNGLAIMCVCNTDLCNSNITWTSESDESHHSNSLFGDDAVKTASVLVGILLVLCLLIIIVKCRSLFKAKQKNPPSLEDYGVLRLCFCQTTKPSEIDVEKIELQQIVSHGNFATVWLGKYQESLVAVKVFPAGLKHKFAAEKEVFELPLMRHSGIIHFLGTGRKPDRDSWLIVLQFAEYGSLHSFLHANTSDWVSTLKLCWSLSQGLSYLHSDLHRHDAHKPPIAHRDLSSSNVLVRADGTCVLCDFGCSTILHSFSRRHRQSHVTSMSLQDLVQMGTRRYMSPEILEGSVNLTNPGYLLEGDIYAMALLLWEILMRCSDLFEGSVVPQHLLPYEYELGANVTKESLILHVCYMDNRPSIPQHWGLISQGSALREILTDSWDCDPDARLTAQCVADRLVSLQTSP